MNNCSLNASSKSQNPGADDILYTIIQKLLKNGKEKLLQILNETYLNRHFPLTWSDAIPTLNQTISRQNSILIDQFP